MVKLTCQTCGKEFERRKAEYNRCLKRGLRNVYCSFKCGGATAAAKLPPPSPQAAAHLDPANRLDEFSPFRWHLRNCKQRSKKESNLTLQDLKEQWEIQGGRCPYTGWKLKNMPTTNHDSQLPLTPDRASLDRIDSSKGYVRGNVQFVAAIAQYAKHTFHEKELFKFAEAVCKKREGEIIGSEI